LAIFNPICDPLTVAARKKGATGKHVIMDLMKFIEKSLGFRLLILGILLILLNPFPVDGRDWEDSSIARKAQYEHLYQVQTEALGRIFNRHPWRQDLNESLGIRAFLQKNYEEALAYLMPPYHSGLLSDHGKYTLVLILLEQGRVVDASQILMQLNPVTLCQVYSTSPVLKKIPLEERVNILRILVERCPGNPDFLYQWGLYQIVDNYEEGIRYIRNAAQIHPGYQSAVNLIEQAQALSLLERAPAYRLTLFGRSYLNLGEYELAQRVLEKAVHLQPDYSEAWAFLGEAKLQMGDGSGKDDLEKAIAQNPQSVMSRVLFSLYLSRIGELDLAIDEMRKVIEIEPHQSIWYLEMGRLTAQKGNLFDAYTFYERASQLDPDNPLVWKALAKFCVTYHFDLSGRGLYSARMALKLAPKDAESYKVMGDVLYNLGDLATAERFWAVSLKLNPSYAEAYLALGQLYLQENRLKESRQMLKNAESFASQDEIRSLAVKLLERYFSESVFTGNTP
jgi:tetratricopeptide (TPR) repeat protein